MNPRTRLVFLALLLAANLLLGATAAPYGPAWWAAAVGFVAAAVALAGSIRIEPTPADGGDQS